MYKIRPINPEFVGSLRKKGMTYQEIAELFGCTRENIRLVLIKVGLGGRLPPSSCPRHPRRNARIGNKYCGQCHQDSRRLGVAVEDLPPVREFIDGPSECLGCGKVVYPGKRSLGRCFKCYQKYLYHTSEKRRKSMNERTYAWHKRKMASDPEYKRRFKEYQSNYSKTKRAAQKAAKAGKEESK